TATAFSGVCQKVTRQAFQPATRYCLTQIQRPMDFSPLKLFSLSCKQSLWLVILQSGNENLIVSCHPEK
ncbi:MAG: hypothetical protein SNJ75_13700, partial [Gemmataceae bacterium]